MATSPSSSGLTAAEGLAGYDTLLYAQSISSSTAHTELHLPSNVSGYAPSLLRSEATPTESSISTGLASRLSGFQLLEEVDGVLEVVGVLELRPNLRSPVYECTFWFLSCCYISADKEEWRTHCASHFRGEEPPKSVQCPLCEEFKTTYEDGHYAWKERIEHVAWHHELGQTLKTSRPDFHLIQHLWQKRLIGDDDLKELNGVWHLSSNDGGVENLPSVREQKTPLRIVPSDYNRKVLAWLDSLDAPEYLATQRDSPAPKEVDKTEALTDAAKAANTKYQIDEDGPDIRLGTTSPRLSHFISVMEHPPSPPVRQEILLPTVLEALLVEPSLNPSPPNPESEAIQLPTVLEAPLVEPSLDPSPLNLESQAAIRLPTVLEAPLAKPLHDPSPPNLELEAAIRPPTVQQVPVINPSLDPLPLSAEELEAELLIPAVLEAQSIEPSFEPSSVEPSRTTSEESNAHSKKRRRGTETHDVESSNVMSKKVRTDKGPAIDSPRPLKPNSVPEVEPSVEPSQRNLEELQKHGKKRRRRSTTLDVEADNTRSKRLRTGDENLGRTQKALKGRPSSDPQGEVLVDERSNSMRRLACPYFKRTPQKYQNMKSCLGPGFTAVSRVKEHLYRKHLLPIHCPRCYEIFENAKALTDHQRATKECKVGDIMPFEGFGKEQEKRLKSKKRSAPNQSEEDKWREIYIILFPDDDPSCFPTVHYDYDLRAVVSFRSTAGLTNYEDFLRLELPRRVRRRLEVAQDDSLEPIQESLKERIANIVESCQEELFRSYQRTMFPATTDLPPVIPKDSELNDTITESRVQTTSRSADSTENLFGGSINHPIPELPEQDGLSIKSAAPHVPRLNPGNAHSDLNPQLGSDPNSQIHKRVLSSSTFDASLQSLESSATSNPQSSGIQHLSNGVFDDNSFSHLPLATIVLDTDCIFPNHENPFPLVQPPGFNNFGDFSELAASRNEFYPIGDSQATISSHPADTVDKSDSGYDTLDSVLQQPKINHDFSFSDELDLDWNGFAFPLQDSPLILSDEWIFNSQEAG